MTELARYDAEGQTSGASASASSPWSIGTGSGSLVINSAAAIHGDVGIRFASSSYKTLNYTESSTAAARVIDFYFKVMAGSANALICGLYDDATSSFRGDVRVNAARTMSIRNISTAVDSTTVTITTGSVYRMAWRTITGTQTLRLYEGNSATPLDTLSGSMTNGTHTRFLTGLIAASTGFQMDFDTIRIGDDWFDPIEEGSPSYPQQLFDGTDVFEAVPVGYFDTSLIPVVPVGQFDTTLIPLEV